MESKPVKKQIVKKKAVKRSLSEAKPGKKAAAPKKQAKKAPKAQVEEETKQEVVAAPSAPATAAATVDPETVFDSLDKFTDGLGTWKETMAAATAKRSFKDLFEYVRGEYKTTVCYPPAHQIFNAYQQATFSDIKVVILGQDPYINPGEAMGLCFSINRGTKVPPSLKNIYIAMENDPKVTFKMPNPIHGDLTQWAKQGVFMLNAVLTVRQGHSNSHQKMGWEEFTKETIRQISKNCSNVVFLLWGKKAHEAGNLVDKKKHLVVCETHPSPLAGTGFKTSKCFSQCNDYLSANGKAQIDWNKL